jgi:hypothetical protein
LTDASAFPGSLRPQPFLLLAQLRRHLRPKILRLEPLPDLQLRIAKRKRSLQPAIARRSHIAPGLPGVTPHSENEGNWRLKTPDAIAQHGSDRG